MNLRNSIALGAAGLAACAAPQATVDTTPENPTAVIETLTVNGGISGMFPYEVNEKRSVRGNMRREDRSMKGTGTFSAYFVTKLAGGAGATITRLDQDRLWMLSPSKKEYTECPAHGCPVSTATDKEEQQAREKAEKEQPKQQTEQGCTTRVASSTFDVKPTGQKKSINGFDASQYSGAWVLRLEDPKKRTTISTVSLDVWTTPLSAPMREAFGLEQAFGRAYGASMMPPGPDRSQVMPAEVTNMMTGYLASLRPQDRAQIGNAYKQLAKIQGYPVYTHLEWRMEGDACGDKGAGEQAKSQPPSTTDMLFGAAASLFAKKEEKPAAPPPLLSFTTEVKALAVQPVRDSAFAVPAGFKKTN